MAPCISSDFPFIPITLNDVEYQSTACLTESSYAWGSTAIIKIFVHIHNLNLFLFNCWKLDCRHRFSLSPTTAYWQALCAHMCGHAPMHLCTCVSMHAYNEYIWHINKHFIFLFFLCRSVCPQSVSQEAPWICRKGFLSCRELGSATLVLAT